MEILEWVKLHWSEILLLYCRLRARSRLSSIR